jgi:ASC-1-like (ASCH) protein
MKLDEPYFTQIKKGIKKVELRLNDEKRSKIKVGDIIIFNDKIKKKVKKLKYYLYFIEAIRDAKLKNVLPGIKTYKQGEEIYYNIPGYKDKELDNGVVNIYF